MFNKVINIVKIGFWIFFGMIIGALLVLDIVIVMLWIQIQTGLK
jgi:hypothetical protein